MGNNCENVYHNLYVTSSIRGKSALDVVQDILEQSIKKGPNKFTAEYNHQLEQLIKLLKVHGAKTAKELGQ